jgi:uncharacterized membrane protein
MGRAFRLTTWTVVIATIMLLTTPIFAQEEAPVCPANLHLNLPIQGVVLESTANRAELDFTVCNGSNQATKVAFVTSGVPEGWTAAVRPNFGPYDITNITLAAADSKDYRLRITPPSDDVSAADFTIQFQLVSNAGAVLLEESVSVKKVAGVAVEAGDIGVTSTFPVLRGPSSNSFEFEVQVRNNTPADVSVDMAAQVFDPSGQTPLPWDVTFTPAFGEQKLIASLSLTPNGSQRVKVTVRPALLSAADSYPVLVTVSNDDYQSEIVLQTTLTGTFDMRLTTPNGRLNVDTNAGSATTTKVLMVNTGTADLRDVRLSASTPANWDVSFSPELNNLDQGFQIDPDVTITPPDNAVPGDYIITIRAQNADTSDTVDLRVTVEQSTIWQWFGIALVVIVVGGMLGVFVRLGRR